jgi:hypothetical protein
MASKATSQFPSSVRMESSSAPRVRWTFSRSKYPTPVYCHVRVVLPAHQPATECKGAPGNQRVALFNEQQTAELREQFIAVLGHDVRTPLSSVVAGVQALQRMPLTTQANRHRGAHEAQGRPDARLIKNILDFARGGLDEGIPVVRRPDHILPRPSLTSLQSLPRSIRTAKCKAHNRYHQAGFVRSGRIAQSLANLLSTCWCTAAWISQSLLLPEAMGTCSSRP